MSTTTCNYDHPWNSCPKCGVGICPKHMTEWLNHPPHASPEQPAREGDGGLICKSHGLAVLMTHVNDGKPCADYLAGGTASTDHARAALVPGLVEALEDLLRYPHERVIADRAQAALAAVRKAGVE